MGPPDTDPGALQHGLLSPGSKAALQRLVEARDYPTCDQDVNVNRCLVHSMGRVEEGRDYR